MLDPIPYFKLYVLTVLIVFLVLILLTRIIENKTPEQIESDDWKFMISISILSPVGVLLLLVMYGEPFFQFLVQERHLKDDES